MKLSYTQRLSLYFFLIFALFTIGIVVFERSREMKFRTAALEEKLDAYTQIVESGKWKVESEDEENSQFSTLNSLRVTLIDRHGNVTYDNAIEGSVTENHTSRPEIILAKKRGKGSDIRTSATNKQKYLYYAKRTNDGFIRVALPYDIQVQQFLQSDNLFLFYIALLFVVTLVIIRFVANRFGASIQQLRNFALSPKDNSPLSILHSQFPNDELGEIGEMIIDNYKQLRKRESEIILEREKLLQHVHASGEGLCFFSANRNVEFCNGLFIQYLNVLAQEPTSNPKNVFTDVAFQSVVDFLANAKKETTYYEAQIGNQGKIFNLRVNIFEDQSFEIIINDITKLEKNRLLKQEMTSNIAHELRTPVTSIRGFLEIALSQPIGSDMAQKFLSKAHTQTIVLTELIQDMSMITKMEEAPASFAQEKIAIEGLLGDLREDLGELLDEKNIRFGWEQVEKTVVVGNRNLLYSIFRNLTDNAIRYAGTDISIIVKTYSEDEKFYYFSFADTGVGIADEHHLNRLFERFYRVTEGRTRDTGGSGLGLAIVKNAVLFHKGTIIVKNRAEGGLEFLFNLSKM